MFKRVPGTRDILPEEIAYWQKLEAVARKVFSLYNYKEIRTPVIEESALFSRSLGEFAEIVKKQMFLIKNKEDSYVLRPEGTASIVRAYLEGNLDKSGRFSKFYYIGPMFRLERPQKGRQRQFHHIGAEAIGSSSPWIDAEIIMVADAILKADQITGYSLNINTLGCPKDKLALVDMLREELKGKLGGLCQECKERFKHNIIRILDCKKQECRKVVKGLSIQDKHLCGDCRQHFNQVKRSLDAEGLSYEVNRQLVRGLDYYTRTVFEFKHDSLGAQDALGAGGRYDNLVKDLGGPQVGSVGFAFGVERLLLVSDLKKHGPQQGLVFIIVLGDRAKDAGARLLSGLRAAGIAADTDYQEKSLKGAMRLADDLGSDLVLILGDNELEKNVVIFKDMRRGKQEQINLEEVVDKVKEKIET